jgi:fatty acid desaturase
MNSIPLHLTRKNGWLTGTNYLANAGVIALMIFLCESELLISVWWVVYPFACILLASRYYALSLFGHDGAHLLLFEKRWANLLFTRLFCHFPLFISTSHYSYMHLTHHRFLGTSMDPDIHIYQRPWRTPSRAGFDIARDLFRGRLFWGFFVYFNGIPQKLKGEKTVQKSDFIWLMVFWIAGAAILTVSHRWTSFFQYWFLPMLLTTVWLQWVNIYQHYHPEGPKPDHAYNAAFKNKFINRLLFPLNSAYHEVHHRHANVPYRFLTHPDLGELKITQVQAVNQSLFSKTGT